MHIPQWPTLEETLRLITEVIAAVFACIAKVSETCIVAICMSVSGHNGIIRTKANCTSGPQKTFVMPQSVVNGLLHPDLCESDLGTARKTNIAVRYKDVETRHWTRDGSLLGAKAPLQLRPHAEVGHPYLYIGHEAFHALGYGSSALAMNEVTLVLPVTSPNGRMGLEELKEAGSAVLRSVLPNAMADILVALPDPQLGHVVECKLHSRNEAHCFRYETLDGWWARAMDAHHVPRFLNTIRAALGLGRDSYAFTSARMC